MDLDQPRYRLSRLLLTLVAISSLQLGRQLSQNSLSDDSPNGKRRDENPGQCESPVATDFENTIKHQRLWPLFLMILESLSVAASVGVVGYQRHLDPNGKSSADLIFWSYLLVLFMLHQGRLRLLNPIQSAVRHHTMLLYIAAWLTALVISLTQQFQAYRVVPPFVGLHSGIVISTTVLVLIRLLLPSSIAPESMTFLDPTQESYSSPLGMISFAWVDSLLVKRWKSGRLEFQNISALSPVDGAALNAQMFQAARSVNLPTIFPCVLTQHDTRVARSGLLWHLFQPFARLLVLQALCAFFYGVLTFIPTLLLQSILQCLEGENDADRGNAWCLPILLSIASSLSVILENCAVWIGQKLGLRVRSIIMNEIYAKALKRQLVSTQQVSTETVMNLLITDVDKVADAAANTLKIWSSVPVQVAMAISLLYSVLGFSAFTGVALIITMIPLNAQIAQKYGAVQMDILAASDAQIYATNEIIRNIRIIKLFAWIPLFAQRIENAQATEL